ncbi:MAG TPA: TIGR00282 family metallophosphoesterase [Oscillospiraceae bacterium]|nr:TIGR00282 family metallophosphoesterase [Oscillospiraceae bacterium]
MEFTVLAVGDVVGDAGVDFLSAHLRAVRRQKAVHFCVVNGENAAGLGILPRQADALLDAGADVITLGNHTFARTQILPYLDDCPRILRPANLAPQLPGRGFGVFEAAGGLRVAVGNLIGRCGMDFGLENPFFEADRLLKRCAADLVLFDFHAEATSEKIAMAYHLDGRAAAVWGTHTHVPTADERVFPKGTGYITDLGMTGPMESVLGIRPEQSVTFFLGGLPGRFETAGGPCRMDACLFVLDPERNRCLSAERLSIQ